MSRLNVWVSPSPESATEKEDDNDALRKLTFCVNDEAMRFLKKDEKKINWITIYGEARSGKSTFMNFLDGDNDSETFLTSGGMETFTNGLHFSSNFQSISDFAGEGGGDSTEDNYVALLDNEGIAQKTVAYDTMMQLPPLMISKVFIYLLKGDPHPRKILENLSLLVSIRERYCDGVTKLGHLHMIIRLETTKKNQTDEDVRNFIFKYGSAEDLNQQRDKIKAAFSGITVWQQSARWLKDSGYEKIDNNEPLRLSDMNEEYHKMFNSFKKTVATQCSESGSILETFPLTTSSSGDVVSRIVDALNSDNESVFPLSFFDQIQRTRVNESKNQAISKVEAWIEQFDLVNNESLEFNSVATLLQEQCSKQEESLQTSIAGYKACFTTEALKEFKEKCKEMEKIFKQKWDEAKRKKLDPKLGELLNEFGARGLLEHDLVKNGILTKEQFLNLRNDKQTYNKIVIKTPPRSKVDIDTINKTVYLNPSYEQRKEKQFQMKKTYEELITKATTIREKIKKENETELDKMTCEVKTEYSAFQEKLKTSLLESNLPNFGSVKEDLMQNLSSFMNSMQSHNENYKVEMKDIPDNSLVEHFKMNMGHFLRANGITEKKTEPLFEYSNAQLKMNHSEASTSEKYFYSNEKARNHAATMMSSSESSFGLAATVSAAGFIGNGLRAFSASGSYKIASMEAGDIKSAKSKSFSNVSSILREFVYCGSIELKKADINFNDRVLEAINGVINSATDDTKKPDNEMIWNFLETYGSHLYLGLNLGGEFLEKSDAHTQTALTKQEMEQSAAEAMSYSASAGGLMLGLRGLGEGGFSVDNKDKSITGGKESGTVRFGETTMRYQRSQRGGNTAAPKELWRNTFFGSENYAVIGVIPEHVTAIWDVLPRLPDKVKEHMRLVWMNKCFNPDIDIANDSTFFSNEKELIKKLNSKYYNEHGVKLLAVPMNDSKKILKKIFRRYTSSK